MLPFIQESIAQRLVLVIAIHVESLYVCVCVLDERALLRRTKFEDTGTLG